MRILPLVLSAVMSASVAFAQELVVDGSSKEAFDASMSAMAASLPPEQKKAFADGAMKLILEGYPLAAGLEGPALLQMLPKAMEAAPATLNGVTLSQILAAAPAPDTAATAQAETGDKLTCLQANVVVSNPRVEKEAWGHAIAMDVTNNLPWAVGFVVMDYAITSEGRSVPWVDSDFGMSVSGGIEPGETREIRTTAGLPKEAPDALTLTATLVDVADAEKRQFIGKPRYTGNSKDVTPLPCK